MTHEEVWAAGALTVDEAAAFAGLSRATLYRLMTAHPSKPARLTSHVTGGRRLIARASLVALLADGDQRPRDLKETP